MAFTRIIRMNFFDDALLNKKYSIKERYFLIGLVCNADDYGKFWCNSSIIKSKVLPCEEKITKNWIKKTLNKLVLDGILCKYEDGDSLYAHFPKWFEKGWFLKQRIDHPREFQHPDCPLCNVESVSRKTHEISRTIQYNSKDFKRFHLKEIEDKEIKPLQFIDKIRNELSSKFFTTEMFKKYHLIDSDKYKNLLEKRINLIKQNQFWDRNHKRDFEGDLLGENEYLEKQSKDNI